MSDFRSGMRPLGDGSSGADQGVRPKHISKFLIGTSLYALSIALAPRAMATCANGNGTILTTGICSNSQNLGTITGTIVSGASLSTGSNTAYDITANSATLTNSGIITTNAATGTLQFVGDGDTLINAGSIINAGPNNSAGPAIEFSEGVGVTVAGINNSGLISAANGIAIQGGTELGDPLGTISGNLINSGKIISTNYDAIIVSNVEGDITNSGSIGSTNAGIVFNYLGGNFLNDTSGTISASAAVDVGVEGVLGTIAGNFTNKGLINGPILVDGQINGNFDNSGVISGNSAINVTSIVGNFTNSGTIDGFINTEFGGNVTNSGTINGRITDFSYTAHSGTFTNTATGVINTPGPSEFLVENGTPITQNFKIINNGIISGGSIGGGCAAPSVCSLNLTNTGIINGGTEQGINTADFTAPSTITNQSGGTIISTTNAMYLSQAGDTVNIDGGTIIGNIVSTERFSDTLVGNINVNLPSNQTFTQGGVYAVGTVNINSGTFVQDNTFYLANGVVNNAVFRTSPVGVPVNVYDLNGNFTQGPNGTLVVEVNPNEAATLHVSGNADLAGTASVYYDPGSYTTTTDALVSATSVTGKFAKLTAQNTVPSNIIPTLQYTATAANLQLTAGVSPPPPPPPPPVSPPPPPPPPPVVVAPEHATIFPEIATVAIFDADRALTSLLNHGLAPTMWDSPEFAFNNVSNPVGGGSGTDSAAMLGAAIPAAIAGYGGWIDATGSFAHVDAGDGAPGYKAQTGGFLAGIDKPVLPNLSLGVAVGYEHFNLNENYTQSYGDVDTGRLDFYGAYNAGFATVSFAAGFGYDGISTTRYLPVGIAKENHHGMEADAAAQISRQFQFGSLQLIPSAGLEYVSLTENNFNETGAGGADLANAGHSNASLQPFIGMEASQTFVAESGTKVIPEVHLQYNQEVLNPRRRLVVTSTDGTPFPINGVTAPHNIITAGLGVSALTTGNLSVYAKYDISLGVGVSTVQDVSAGLSYKFW